jgi:hypothetical protein
VTDVALKDRLPEKSFKISSSRPSNLRLLHDFPVNVAAEQLSQPGGVLVW